MAMGSESHIPRVECAAVPAEADGRPAQNHFGLRLRFVDIIQCNMIRFQNNQPT